MRVEVEKEIERILPLIPKEPPENTIEILKKRGYLKSERLLYTELTTVIMTKVKW